MSYLELLVLTVSLLGAWMWLVHSRHQSRNLRRLPLPPGPPRYPLIGSLLSLPASEGWIKAAEWKETYGGIVYLETFGQKVLFVNTYVDAVELLEKRSLIYSSRPWLPMALDPDLEDWGWSVTLLPYGDKLRKAREFYHKHLQGRVVPEYWELQTRSAHNMVCRLLETPDEYEKHTRLMAATISVMFTYGHKVTSVKDDYISLAEQSNKMFGDAIAPGKYLVNVIPWLKHVPDWFPGAGFKQVAKTAKALSLRLRQEQYQLTRAAHSAGTAQPSLVTRLIDQCTKEDGRLDSEEEEVIMAASATLYAAGVDTTVSMLETFILAMVLYPDVQRRGQEEISRVIGTDRLPTMEDRANLPYIDAICSECLRWNPVVPSGIPHLLTADDEYNGYLLPQGTTVLPNQWAMLFDPAEYPGPELFRPERFLPRDGQASVPRHPRKVAFGFGRRICPGRHLAENSIFIGIATMLATLDFGKAVGSDGNAQTPKVEFECAAVSLPKPFKFTVKACSERAIAVLHRSIDSEQ